MVFGEQRKPRQVIAYVLQRRDELLTFVRALAITGNDALRDLGGLQDIVEGSKGESELPS